MITHSGQHIMYYFYVNFVNQGCFSPSKMAREGWRHDALEFRGKVDVVMHELELKVAYALENLVVENQLPHAVQDPRHVILLEMELGLPHLHSVDELRPFQPFNP